MLSLTWLSQLVGVYIDALMPMAVRVSLGCQRTPAWRSHYEVALKHSPPCAWHRGASPASDEQLLTLRPKDRRGFAAGIVKTVSNPVIRV